jgi:hypothetical protein
MDEEDVDDELGLPKELINIVSLKEKRELLQYKQTHNEVRTPLLASPSTVFYLLTYIQLISDNIYLRARLMSFVIA